jgi:hypothetical protein
MATHISQVQTKKRSRRYPGEAAANEVIGYLNWVEAGARREAPEPIRFSKRGNSWVALHKPQPYRAMKEWVSRALKDFRRLEGKVRKTGQQPEWSSRQGRRGPKSFENLLYHYVLKLSSFAVDWKPERGFVFISEDPRVHAVLGILELFRRGRLARVKKCLHCRSWFYARFKHQQFCSDTAKKCQWNRYHTPEWRRKHSEQNRQHQREYRQRMFKKGA